MSARRDPSKTGRFYDTSLFLLACIAGGAFFLLDGPGRVRAYFGPDDAPTEMFTASALEAPIQVEAAEMIEETPEPPPILPEGETLPPD